MASLKVIFRPVLCALAMLAVWSVTPSHAWQAGGGQRVILISIDGLTANDTAQLDTLDVDIPNLRALAANGVKADGVIPTTPANTFPNHTTMITGAPAARHGVWDNDTFAPGTDRHGLFYHYYSDIRVPTLFDKTREAGMRSMAIWWPVTTGAPVDALLPDVPGDVRERGKYVYNGSTPDIRAALGSPDNAGDMRDELRLDAAIAGLASDPQFMAIHFTELDAAQHDFGEGSPEAYAALEKTDRILGEFLAALDVRGMRDGAAIVVASDHGFSPLHSAAFPGRLFRTYGLLEINEAGDVTDWSAYPWPGGRALAIYINPEKDNQAEIRETVDHVIGILQDHPADFVGQVWRGEEMRRWGGYPEAYALINARAGHAFGGNLDSVLFRTGTSTRGIHGFAPTDAGLYGSLILSGAGINPDASLGTVAMEDIAPTIAYLLGLDLSESDGRVLEEALQ